jgi:predicted phosphodiesterase
MTDVHANLPALQAALNDIKKAGYDLLIHTGDAIAIGPYPAECLALLMATPNVCLITGNHESYFVEGVPEAQPSLMSDGEVQHQHWTHAQLGPAMKAVVATWPYHVDIEEDGVTATFLHYPLEESGREFQSVRLINPSASQLDAAFHEVDSSVIFCGHEHQSFDVQGRSRYVNPGSLGCSAEAVARYCALDISNHGFSIQHHAVEYDRTELFHTFEERQVPDRHFILKTFFGQNI